MNKAIISTILLTGFLSVKGFAQNVTDDLMAGQEPQTGSILYYAAPNGNSQGTWAMPSSIPGLTGAQGEQGVQGEQGLQGIQGEQGIQGIQGETGVIDQETLNTINTNQTNETSNRIDADTTLTNNLNQEVVNRTEGDKQLQNGLNATNNRINGLENEVHKLGETKAILGGTVRVLDSRKFEVHVFDNYNVKQGHNDSFGVLVGYKLGKSYEEKEIDELKSMLKMYKDKDKVFKPQSKPMLKDLK